MTLGEKIKKLRNEKGLTQKDLADQVHVTFQTVSKWENDENEPDVSTLRELAKLFGCSMDYLLSEEEKEEIKEEPKAESVVTPATPVEQVTKTIIIHQKELHVCEVCKKDIPEDDLAMEQICTRPAGRGHAAEYRQGYYHKACLTELQQKRIEAAAKERAAKASRAKKICFGWGIAGGVIALAISLLIMLFGEKGQIHPALAVLISVGIGYSIFAMIYCILCGSYIGDVFLWCATLSVKFPGVIFSWDIEGFIFLIAIKVLFAILGFIIGIFALLFAIVMSATLGGISFPFVLIHNINNDYADAL